MLCLGANNRPSFIVSRPRAECAGGSPEHPAAESEVAVDGPLQVPGYQLHSEHERGCPSPPGATPADCLFGREEYPGEPNLGGCYCRYIDRKLRHTTSGKSYTGDNCCRPTRAEAADERVHSPARECDVRELHHLEGTGEREEPEEPGERVIQLVLRVAREG